MSIHYTLKDDGDQVIDTSSGKDPLVYIHGFGNIIPGLEQALEGKSKGEKLQVSVPPEQAYGNHNAEMVQVVPKERMANLPEIEVGARLKADTENGPLVFTVTEIRDNEYVLDGNHPLAGATLHFDVEVMDLRDATSEELEHGHVHGPGGHDH